MNRPQRPRVLKTRVRTRHSIFTRRRLTFLALVLSLTFVFVIFKYDNGKSLESQDLETIALPAEEDTVVDDLLKDQKPEITYDRVNATFFVLARNLDLHGLLGLIESVEERFNHKYHYDWVFANDEEFSQKFIQLTLNAVSGTPTYEKIPKEFWGYPEWIDQDLAADVRDQMEKENIKYGGSELYRHMCRFNSGFFYKLEAMKKYKYYWRVEPDITFNCDIDYDLFKYMEDHNKVYAFSMAPFEIHTTVLSLWNVVKNFTSQYPEYVSDNNSEEFITDDGGETFNMCHFWSNFEVGDMDFYRSQTYEDFFAWIDYSGGIYYERWGDAPIHTMAMSLLLDKDKLYYVDNTGYFHNPNGQCPRDRETLDRLNCDCASEFDYNWLPESCIPLYFEINNMTRPKSVEGWKLKTHIGEVENSNPLVQSGLEVISE